MGQVNLNQEICAKRFHLFSKLVRNTELSITFVLWKEPEKFFLSFWLGIHLLPIYVNGYLLS